MHVSYDAKIQYPEIFNFTLELGKAKQRKIEKRKIISRKVWVLNGQVGYAGQSSISVFLHPDWFYLSGTGLPRLSWKRGR